MPYVEGFGTWPFGEEWLFEAAATVYVPLLRPPRRPRAAPLTLSLTPVLADQLAAPGVARALVVVPARPARRRRTRWTPRAAAPAASRRWPPRSSAPAATTRAPPTRSSALGDGGLARGAGARTPRGRRPRPTPSCRWSPPTPACALQLRAGIEAHRARVGDGAWGGGFWLPECAHAPWLRPAAGGGRRPRDVRRPDRRPGPGARTAAGAPRTGRCWCPIDRAGDRAGVERRRLPGRGAPTATPTQDRLPPPSVGQRRRRLRPRPRAASRPPPTPRDFLPTSAAPADGGLSVCALDTELLGHHWYEGLRLAGGGARRGAARQGVELVAAGRRAGAARPGRRARRPADDHWGDAAHAVDLGRSAGRRPRLRHPRAPSCDVLAAGDAPTPARSASCWRCSPATGPS